MTYLSKWCVFMLIFALPFSKSIIEICIAVSLAALVVKKVLLKERLLPDEPMKIPLLLFLLLSCLSFFNTEFLYLSFRALITKYIKFVLLYFIVIETIDTREKLKDLLTMAVLSFTIITIDGYIQYYISHVDLLHYYPSFKYVPDYNVVSFIGFPTASFPYPNDLAAWLIMFLLPILSVILFAVISWRKRVICMLLFVIAFYLFILAKARSAWLGLTISIPVLLLFNIKKAFIVVLAILLVLSAVVLINSILPSDAKYSTSLLSDIFSFTSISDRMTMWQNSWKVYMRHPVIGNGINTFYRHYMEVREDEYKHKKGSYAHNCYLQMAAETGVIGLGAFLFAIAVFLVTSVRKIVRMKHNVYGPISVGLLAGIIAFLIHSFFDTNLYSLNLAALFWFSLGLETAISRVIPERS
jgi:O-antigen ligase